MEFHTLTPNGRASICRSPAEESMEGPMGDCSELGSPRSTRGQIQLENSLLSIASTVTVHRATQRESVAERSRACTGMDRIHSNCARGDHSPMVRIRDPQALTGWHVSPRHCPWVWVFLYDYHENGLTKCCTSAHVCDGL